MRISALSRIALLHLFLSTSPNILHSQEIQRSIAFPVTNQTVTFTVPGIGEGGVINLVSSHGTTTQLVVNAQEQATWTPSKYGKYTLTAGAATDTMWVTARPMKFHWWNCTTAQKNVTEVMQRNATWQARGVTRVDWTGGDYLAAPENGGYTTAQQWYDNWSYAYDTGGMALDEMWCDDVARTNAMLQAISMVRQTRGPAYSINVWSAGFGSNFATGASNLKANNATVLIEDYYGGWNNHKSRWDAVRSYGLQNQAISGIWPGTTNLTNETQLRTDVALVRLAAPNANGIAIFAPTDQNYTPKDLNTVLNDCDKAIEDYYLKPLIHLSVTSSAQVDVWNLGNDDATGFSLQLLNGSLGVVQTIDLSTLAANGHQFVSWPAGVVYAKVINPPNTANLYVGNSQYSNGLYPLQVPGRYTFTNANGDNLWSTFSAWDPHGPPPGNIDSGNSAYFDGNSPVIVAAAGGETSISSVQFKSPGWILNGNPTSQNLFTYGVTSEGSGTNTIKIGYRTSAGVGASFNVGNGNTVAMDGLISGPGGLSKQGAGTLKLTWNNSYTGTTSLNTGNLIFMAPGNADWTLPTGTKTIANGTSMKVDLTPQSPNQYRATNLGATTVNAGGVLDLYSTAYNLNSWHLVNFWTATGGGTIRITGGGAIGCWTGTSNALSGFTGLLDIQNGQFAVNIDSATTLGGTLDVNMSATGKLDLRTGQLTVDALDGAAGSEILKSWNTAVTLTVGNADGSGNFAGTISNANGTIALTKVGNGTQNLSGSNSFTGATTINGGTLALSGGSAIADSGATTLANTPGVQLLLNSSETIGSLAGGGANGGNVNLQGNTLTVGNATNTTFAGSLSGTGGLTKAGSGILTLTGVNNYTGDTTVIAGILSLNHAFLSNNSTVSIATNAVLNLNTGASDTVAHLILGGVTVPPGTYNAAHPAYGSYFTGTGSLFVGTAYDSWISSKGLSGAELLPTADPDKDELPNAIEFVLGGDPNPANANANSGALLPTVSQTATDLVFTFRRSDTANAMPGIGITSEFGSNLAGWTTAVHGVNGVMITETSDGFGPGVDRVAVSIPKSQAADARLFVRLRVALP